MSNKKSYPTSFRLKEINIKMLEELCNKYQKNRSQMITFLIEKEYLFNKESDKDE